ncbi:esterase S-like [Drosophila hydei]|uniref:carboxylesterase n=1 Tax=Drosophila hydei TaxID=7224 RepID=A0A6J1MCK1_DROHY|nr:esterase S-like [Drosophila hydei]
MNAIVLSVALTLACTAAAFNDPLLVELTNGELRGRDKGFYYSFESIPYAQPPIDALRLEDPVPYGGIWEHTFDATKPPTECLQWNQFIQQPDKLTGSEDCLTVSIYKPKNASRKSFPVVANIFGGAWTFGSSLDDGVELIMNRGNVIVAKINYRVGPLGFLSTGDNVLPGNYGLKDQRLAIQWIKQNIARFGADPENIILLGFGTGGSSVHLQLMHKDMEKIVKGGISISGTATSPFAVQPSGRELSFKYAKILGCDNAETSTELKECLKKIKADDFVSALRHLKVFDYVLFGAFNPVIESSESDSAFLTEFPIETIRNGRSAQVPWLASYTTENGIYNAALLLQRDSNGNARIEELKFRWNELAPYFFSYPYLWKRSERDNRSRKLKLKYLGFKNFSVENYFDVQRMFTNELYKNGIEVALDAHRRYGSSPVYAYVYDNPADNSFTQFLSRRTDLFLGTGLGDDYYLMFSNPIRNPLRADEKIISQKLVKLVEEFAQAGNLTYDNCVFPDNRGKRQFQLVAIKRTQCEVLEAKYLPDKVSNNLPLSPVVVQ